MLSKLTARHWLLFLGGVILVNAQENLEPCGDAFYDPARYTCYDTNFLCPILPGGATLRCGDACYLTDMYSCSNGNLVYPPASYSVSVVSTTLATYTTSLPSQTASPAPGCSAAAVAFNLSAPPYTDYFYTDCHGATQVEITSPLPDSNLSLIGPRLLVAWPAGNSGVVGFFAPQSGKNGTLALSLSNLPGGASSVQPVFIKPNSSSLTGNPRVGVTGLIHFNNSAVLDLVMLGSIRTIRDFTEGPSILVPEIQNANHFSVSPSGVARISRIWLDNMTMTEFAFTPSGGASDTITLKERKFYFKSGTYMFNATFDYPQLTQLSRTEVFNSSSYDLITQQPIHTKSVAFLSYTQKLLAGGWRFLTYFGRDTMISLLLMQPVLSQGEGGAIETVIGAVLERINKTTGSVCHEETIGDYATYTNQIDFNKSSTMPLCSYIMIDSDYYLPVVMQNYFLDTEVGRARQTKFWTQKSILNFGNKGLGYTELALLNAERIMSHAEAFAQPGGQTKANLRYLEPTQIVGEWRDSTYGIGGGRVPFDVNTGLVPAALRSISALTAAGFFPEHPEWTKQAASYAQVWEDNTLDFFKVSVSASQAKSLVSTYVKRAGFKGSSQTDVIPSTGITYYGLALDGYNNQSIVEVMNTDSCFRLYLLNTTNQEQLTDFVNQTASHVQLPFPVGLSTPIGMLVANPAYGANPVYAANWTTSAYHGTVVWSWQLAMMSAGLERQLWRCNPGGDKPDFCTIPSVYNNVKGAYNHLWDIIEQNQAHLANEVWSWTYDDGFHYTPYGSLSPTESDAIQLWSLTFLSVTRDASLQ